MDYVDLYQVHRWDPQTPIEETMEALHDVVRAGKARYVGASSMYAWQFAKAQHVAEHHGWTSFVSMQNHYNLVYREEEREMIPQCIDQGVGVLPWSPLARGLLAGTRTREGERRTRRAETDAYADQLYGRPEGFDVVDRVEAVAAERGAPAAQVALAWLLHKPGVTAPIVGATKLAHLEDALAAAELTLSADESVGSRSRTARTPCWGTTSDGLNAMAAGTARGGRVRIASDVAVVAPADSVLPPAARSGTRSDRSQGALSARASPPCILPEGSA